MIDRLPLDLFDEALEAAPESDAVRLAMCQWCGVEHPADDVTCPVCGATLLREIVEHQATVKIAPAPVAVEHCPWCTLPVGPKDDFCGECGAVLRGDPDLVLPGVNVPLPDSVLWSRALAERDLDDDEDPTDTIVDLIYLVGDALLKMRGRM